MATCSSVLAWRVPGMGAWWAAMYGVAQSRTQLMWLSSSSSSIRDLMSWYSSMYLAQWLKFFFYFSGPAHWVWILSLPQFSSVTFGILFNLQGSVCSAENMGHWYIAPALGYVRCNGCKIHYSAFYMKWFEFWTHLMLWKTAMLSPIPPSLSSYIALVKRFSPSFKLCQSDGHLETKWTVFCNAGYSFDISQCQDWKGGWLYTDWVGTSA